MALTKVGADGVDLTDTFAFTGTVSGAISFAVVSDQKTSGTAGGTPPSTNFETRDLNTEVFDPDGIVTVSSNQFTLIAGTYIIDWECPHYRGNSATSVLYDITGTATVETSTSGYDFTTSGMTVGLTTGRARVVITSNNTYEIRMKVSTAYTTVGYGVAANGNPETYTTVRIMKIG